MKERRGQIQRQTEETGIKVDLQIDGRGRCESQTGLGFLDHMLALLARHSGFDLDVQVAGDLNVDDHHSIEDVGIVLGQALAEALKDKRGIERYGFSILPMDEVLVVVAVDLGGRFTFESNYRPVRDRVGELSTEMVNHFFQSLSVEARMNLHFHFLNSGENEHHRIEAMFKGLARALRTAVRLNPDSPGEVPSTKGLL